MESKYETDGTAGIPGTIEDLAARTAQFGENRLPEPLHESWWAIFFECFKDIILIILLVAAVVALIVGIIEHGAATGWIDGVAILIAVAIVATVTATNDYNKQLQFRKLSEESQNTIESRVVRAGREMIIRVSHIVVGDLVLIDTGDKLPADGVIVRSTDLRVNESSCVVAQEAGGASRGANADRLAQPHPSPTAATPLLPPPPPPSSPAPPPASPARATRSASHWPRRACWPARP